MTQRIYFGSCPLSDREADALEHQFLDGRHYRDLIGGERSEDTDVFRPDGTPLLLYRRRVPSVRRALAAAVPALREAACWSENRQARSGAIGFLDPTPREPYCRPTKFTRDRPDLWADVLPLLGALDETFRKALPDRHAIQSAFARRTCRDFVIPSTCFTTATVNASHRFPAHPDKGNLCCGFSVMTVWREGSFRGGVLIFPQWELAVEMCCGDVLLFDGSELHGNSPFVGAEGAYERLSVVAYYRRRMLDAGTQAEELAKARRRLSRS